MKICSNCGSQLADSAQFCHVCSQPQPTRPKLGPWIIAVVLLLVGLAVGSGIGAVAFAGSRTVVTESLTVTSTTTNLGLPSAALVEYCFSPGGNCASRVVYWIGRANSSIHILIYTFTLDTISNALIQAKQNKPNLDIRIVWDASSSNETGSEYQKLLNAGFQIHIDHRSGLLHDKVAIIDSHIILTGSFNWSNAANETNRENLLVLDSQAWGTTYEQNFELNWQATA